MNCVLEYKGYYISPSDNAITYNEEDGLYNGTIPEMKDMISFCGESEEELINSFKRSIDHYLELCTKVGKTPEVQDRNKLRGEFVNGCFSVC